MNRWDEFRWSLALRLCALVVMCSTVGAALITARAQATFATPEAAVQALIEAASAAGVEPLFAIFGEEGKDLIASSDEVTSRKNREVFAVASREGWRLVDQGANRKTLTIGNEGWPFPVPLLKAAGKWRFDVATGKEEVLARRIGRNELEVIALCHTYVAAQRRYAADGHDGNPPGAYATTFRSDAGKQNGLYWPAEHGQKRSPLGDLVAQAAEEGRTLAQGSQQPSPFHGYYFKILKAEGGFAMVAWPSQYDVTGIMTFIVNQDGIVRQKDLGKATATTATAMTSYRRDSSWTVVK